ncbi:MAG TPA: hypothetical protein DEB50_09670 [Desulfobacter sp.]|nr:hypothetical protein [Desulfobacter sp.]
MFCKLTLAESFLTFLEIYNSIPKFLKKFHVIGVRPRLSPGFILVNPFVAEKRTKGQENKKNKKSISWMKI